MVQPRYIPSHRKPMSEQTVGLNTSTVDSSTAGWSNRGSVEAHRLFGHRLAMGRYIPRGIQTLIPALRNSRRRNAKKLTYTGRLGDSPDDSIQYWITTNLLVHLAPLHLGLTSRRRGRSSSRQKSKPLTESRGYPLSHPKRDLSTLNDARVAKKGGFDKVTLGPEVSVAFCNM